MRTFNIEWRIISSPPRRIRSAQHAFLARREARARMAIQFRALTKYARKARAHAGQYDVHDAVAGAAFNYWTKMIIRYQEAERVQRSMIAAEQAERERYHG